MSANQSQVLRGKRGRCHVLPVIGRGICGCRGSTILEDDFPWGKFHFEKNRCLKDIIFISITLFVASDKDLHYTTNNS